MSVRIDQMVMVPSGEPVKYMVVDVERHLTLDILDVDQYESADAALHVAKQCAERYKASAWVSPFLKNKRILRDGYGTARKLARLTLSLYNGSAYPFDCSGFRGFDREHLEIAIELIRSYNRHGERDSDFMSVATELKKIYPSET